MSDNDATPAGSVEFVDTHRPTLAAGDHTITATLTINSKLETNPKYTIDNGIAHVERQFSVAGPRFSLSPQDIHTVFPPPGSLGDHAHVLPHVVLTRSTLPWERAAGDPDDSPWLALLLFDQEEMKSVKRESVSLKSLKEEWGWELHTGDHEEDMCTVIDVDVGLLQAIVPKPEDLRPLAHVRRRQNADETWQERAVIVGNRLPKRGGSSMAHLVSVEGRYNKDEFLFTKAKKHEKIRLVSLKSWRFSCLKEEHQFEKLLQHLHAGTLRPPENENGDAEQNLRIGRVPLRHQTRSGQETISWYRGPLAPGPDGRELPEKPVRASDTLLCYDKELGMVDVSYAAAWELGRLLMVQSKNASVALFNWKRCCTQDRRTHDANGPFCCPEHLPFQTTQRRFDFPLDWFQRLARLENVPFNYLVPDEKMLPQESISFFQLDPIWLDCLVDGAFSIGSVTLEECTHDCDHYRQEQLAGLEKNMPKSGFLLRSAAVAGWPDLEVDGYAKFEGNSATDKMPPIVKPRFLSKNVLLCLFPNVVQVVDIHLPPEVLHFGGIESNNGGYSKDGKPVHERDKGGRVIKIHDLAHDLDNATSSAKFAKQMIDVAPRVRFALHSG